MRLPAVWRAACLVAAIVLVVNLFVIGAQPIAVGLIPSPWDKLAHALLIAIALADELLQADLPGRIVSAADLTADVVGAVAGVAAMALVLARRVGA